MLYLKLPWETIQFYLLSQVQNHCWVIWMFLPRSRGCRTGQAIGKRNWSKMCRVLWRVSKRGRRIRVSGILYCYFSIYSPLFSAVFCSTTLWASSSYSIVVWCTVITPDTSLDTLSSFFQHENFAIVWAPFLLQLFDCISVACQPRTDVERKFVLAVVTKEDLQR